MPFFHFLRGDDKPGGGVFGFLDKTRQYASYVPGSVAEAIPKTGSQVAHVGKDIVQGSLKIPETASRSYIQGINDLLDKIAPSTATGERFDTKVDPFRKALYGTEDLQTYQTRAKGYKKTLEGSRFRDYSGPLAFIGGVTSAAADVAPLGKGPGTIVKQLVKSSSKKEIISTLVKNGIDSGVAEKVAPHIAQTKDPYIIRNLLDQAHGLPPSTTLPSPPPISDIIPTPVEGSARAAGQGRTTEERLFGQDGVAWQDYNKRYEAGRLHNAASEDEFNLRSEGVLFDSSVDNKILDDLIKGDKKVGYIENQAYEPQFKMKAKQNGLYTRELNGVTVAGQNKADVDKYVNAALQGKSLSGKEEFGLIGYKPERFAIPEEAKVVDESQIVNPIDTSLAPEEKVKALQELSKQNEPVIAKALQEFDAKQGTVSKTSFKDPENILSKAARPEIRDQKPWHDVEHIRDSLRFKSVINKLDDVPAAIDNIIKSTGAEIVKLDTAKMFKPKEWGFRFAAVDLRMPNGQLVEYYMPIKEVEETKRAVGHKLFENWRNTEEAERIAKRHQYNKDLYSSRKAYQTAWEEALRSSKLTPSEAAASWAKVEASLSDKGVKLSLRSSGEGEATRQVPSGLRTAETSTVSSAPSTNTRPSSDLEAINSGIESSISPIIPDKAPVSQVKERGFIKNVEKSPLSEPQVAQGVKELSDADRLYQTAPNTQTLDKAEKYISKNPIAATREVMKGSSTKPLKDIQAQAMLLMGRAQAEGSEEGYKQAIDIVKAVSKRATEAGQGSQILSVWSRFTPEGMLRYAQGEIDNANAAKGFVSKLFKKDDLELDPGTAKKITENMMRVETMEDGPEKFALVKETMNLIAEKIPPGASEIFDAYRYQNLLSSPRTHLRNALGNLTQAFFTRPLTLATKGGIDWVKAGLTGAERQHYLKDVPTYYKHLVNNFGDSMEGLREGWKGDIQNPDLLDVNAYRNKNVPKAFTVIPRAMEASDRFLQHMVGSAEYAVQKSHGVADDVAAQKSQEIAKYALFRNITDPKNKTGQGHLLSTIDKATNLVTRAGKEFKPIRWFVPFIRTPMNITKQFIEYSPAGFATLYGASGARRDEQLAKALIGSSILGIGAKMALDGDTTWAAPSNKKERDEFYATGRKPYSVRIGDKWVPMIYFGPFGFALGTAAAVKDAHEKAPMSQGEAEKLAGSLTNLSKFFAQQTYVSGMSHFVDMLSGNTDSSVMGSFAQTVSQAIPLSALQRFAAGIVDPIFRDQKGFVGTLKGGTPYVSKSLPAKTDIFTGEDVKRNQTDYFLPYTMGMSNPESREAKEAAYQFQRMVLGRASSYRTETEDKIKAAYEAGDTEKAAKLAEDYNEQLAKRGDQWNDKYGTYANEVIQELYNSEKITDRGLTSLYNNVGRK